MLKKLIALFKRKPDPRKQYVHIVCKDKQCKYNIHGACSHREPAITLKHDGTYTCWSKQVSKVHTKQ